MLGKSVFTKEELEAIYEHAAMLAERGPGYISEVRHQSAQLTLGLYAGMRSRGLSREDQEDLVKAIDTMRKVADTADGILQLYGKDEASLIREEMIRTAFGIDGEREV
jgi:hypothetical protein